MTTPAVQEKVPPTQDQALTVYFDGACPLCRREIGLYKGMNGAEQINWVDVSSCDAATLPPDRSRPELLSRFHIKSEDGELKDGAAAFFEIWRKLPAFSWLAPLRHIPFVVTIAEYVYSAFLKVRPYIQRLFKA